MNPWKIFVFVLLFVLSAPLPPLVLGGDEINNGGGLAEKNIAYAYINLERHIVFCLNAVNCYLSKEEKELLEKIHQSLPKERENPNQLKFISGKENPSFFFIDGQIRLAKTGDEVGDPLYFNKDLIYEEKIAGIEQQQPISIASATTTLIHELGHHHQVKDHILLDLLGQKVSFVFQNSITAISPFPRSKHVTLWAFHSPKRERNHFSSLLLYVGNDVVDLSSAFKKSIYCPSNDETKKQRPSGGIAFNLHWENTWVRGSKTLFTIEGNLDIQCPGLSFRKKYYAENLIRIRFKTEGRIRKMSHLKKDTIVISQLRPPRSTW